MKRVFAPGCALLVYKPELGKKLLEFLDKDLGDIDEHLICCHHDPKLPVGTQVINTCPGCDRRYRQLYEGITTVSLWEVLADSKTFPFPDYQGKEMAIHDACPTRDQERVHNAIRTLLGRMNIKVVEPDKTRTKSICCGSNLYGTIPVAQVKEQMNKRAAEMPADDVVVYCVSCCKSMQIGEKKPRYMVDLLLGSATVPKAIGLEEWRAEVERFREEH